MPFRVSVSGGRLRFQYLPLTEAGVEGGPEELCILTPEQNRTHQQFYITKNRKELAIGYNMGTSLQKHVCHL